MNSYEENIIEIPFQAINGFAKGFLCDRGAGDRQS